jgi:negative regulator of sigma E activity
LEFETDMPSLLHQLDNESALVMFIAGELPAEDHAVVERRLASDPEFRAQFEKLRSAYHGVEDAIALADAGERVALPEATAARRVGQAVRSWQVRRLAEPRERELGGRLRLPAWAYVAASVAVAAVVALAIWGLRSDNGNMRLGPLATNLPQASTDSDPTSMAVNVDANPANPVTEFDPYPLVRQDSETATLADAEDELYAMSERSPGDVPAILLVGDTDEQ